MHTFINLYGEYGENAKLSCLIKLSFRNDMNHVKDTKMAIFCVITSRDITAYSDLIGQDLY